MNNKNYLMQAFFVVLVFGLVATGVYAFRNLNVEKMRGADVIGGDRDSHGCLTSAGYSWCESKEKCVQPLEEVCLTEATEGDINSIKQAFMDKYEKEAREVQVTVDMFTGSYARGGVKFIVQDNFGSGGIFLAYREGEIWKIAFDGNGMYDCEELAVYNFPEEMLTGCSYREGLEEIGNVELSNPASTYCVEQGGELVISDNEDGQYGVCVFPSGNECEEWVFFRGECEDK